MSEGSGKKNANMPSPFRPCLHQSEEDQLRARRRHAWSNAERNGVEGKEVGLQRGKDRGCGDMEWGGLEISLENTTAKSLYLLFDTPMPRQ